MEKEIYRVGNFMQLSSLARCMSTIKDITQQLIPCEHHILFSQNWAERTSNQIWFAIAH